MKEIVQEILIGAAGDGTGGLVAGLLINISGHMQRKLQPEPQRRAFSTALKVALISAFNILPKNVTPLSQYYLSAFADFLRDTVAQKELSLLIEPTEIEHLNLPHLRNQFERITKGYQPAQIPDIADYFEPFVQTLMTAFRIAIEESETLTNLNMVVRLRRIDEALRLDIKANEITAHNSERLAQSSEMLVQLVEQLLHQQALLVNKETMSGQISNEQVGSVLDDYCQWVINQYSTIYPIHKRTGFSLNQLFIDISLDEPINYGDQITEQELTKELQLIRSKGIRANGVAFASEILNQGRHLFVLGAPGSGKSTIVKHLAVQAALLRVQIPIVLILREWDGNSTFEEFVEAEFRRGGITHNSIWEQWAKSGKLLFLLDGLDEIKQNQREKLQNRLQRMATSHDYKTTQFLITCRTATTGYYMHGFNYVRLSPFQPKQIKKFIENWFVDDPKQGALMGKELEENLAAYELTHTPLLLSLLCLLFKRQGQLCSNRIELYERALDVLLTEWDEFKLVSRDYFGLNRIQKHELFTHLAWQFCNTGDQYEVVVTEDKIGGWIQDFWKKGVEPRKILRSIESQHGLIQKRTDNFYTFSHLTFQDYFIAKHIINTIKFDKCLENIGNQQWEEIFLLIANSPQAGNTFCYEILNYLNNLIAKKSEIQSLLHIAGHIVESLSKYSYHGPAVLRAYCLAELVGRINRGVRKSAHRLKSRQTMNRDLSKTRVSAHRQTLEYSNFLSQIYNLFIEISLIMDSSLTTDHLLNIAATRVLTFEHYRDLGLDLSEDLNRIVESLSQQQSSIVNIFEQLITSPTPNSTTSNNSLQRYLELIYITQHKLRCYMKLENMHKVTSKKQNEVKYLLQLVEIQDGQILINYLKGVLLLVRCLKVANFQNRNLFEAQLLQSN